MQRFLVLVKGGALLGEEAFRAQELSMLWTFAFQ